MTWWSSGRAARARLRRAVDVINHRVRPSELLTPVRLTTAAARALLAGRPPRTVLREVRDITREEVRRRWRNHRPLFADDSPVPDTDGSATGGEQPKVLGDC